MIVSVENLRSVLDQNNIKLKFNEADAKRLVERYVWNLDNIGETYPPVGKRISKLLQVIFKLSNQRLIFKCLLKWNSIKADFI